MLSNATALVSIPIEIFCDDGLEHDEVFMLQLQPLVNDSKLFIDPSEGSVTIINDDCKCALLLMKVYKLLNY